MDKPKLKKGEMHDAEWVKFGKKKMKEAGYYDGDENDGDFDDKFEDAIKRFDSDNGIQSEEGAVDDQTWNRLTELVGEY